LVESVKDPYVLHKTDADANVNPASLQGNALSLGFFGAVKAGRRPVPYAIAEYWRAGGLRIQKHQSFSLMAKRYVWTMKRF